MIKRKRDHKGSNIVVGMLTHCDLILVVTWILRFLDKLVCESTSNPKSLEVTLFSFRS